MIERFDIQDKLISRHKKNYGECRMLFDYVCSLAGRVHQADEEESVEFYPWISEWGSFWEEIQVARTAWGRRTLLISGLLHSGESSLPAPPIRLGIAVVENR